MSIALWILVGYGVYTAGVVASGWMLRREGTGIEDGTLIDRAMQWPVRFLVFLALAAVATIPVAILSLLKIIGRKE